MNDKIIKEQNKQYTIIQTSKYESIMPLTLPYKEGKQMLKVHLSVNGLPGINMVCWLCEIDHDLLDNAHNQVVYYW